MLFQKIGFNPFQTKTLGFLQFESLTQYFIHIQSATLFRGRVATAVASLLFQKKNKNGLALTWDEIENPTRIHYVRKTYAGRAGPLCHPSYYLSIFMYLPFYPKLELNQYQ